MRPSTRRALKWGIPLLALQAIVAFLLAGADGPPNPSFRAAAAGSASTEAPALDRIGSFGQISFHVDATGVAFGSGPAVAAARCALLAATAAQQNQGMMGMTDLAGYDGMLFRFDADTEARFYMKDTLIPLSIAWFDGEGRLVSATDMAPCGDQPVCPTYGADGPYRYALEVPEGNLAALGIGPGARLVFGRERC
ncbi:MAG: uncharacterized protein QOI99_2289 [Actinomycetota bacterium]|nr:uncharacterized protein [Actinomycetota bacterium]